MRAGSFIIRAQGREISHGLKPRERPRAQSGWQNDRTGRDRTADSGGVRVQRFAGEDAGRQGSAL
jgi:hypothetical protein